MQSLAALVLMHEGERILPRSMSGDGRGLGGGSQFVSAPTIHALDAQGVDRVLAKRQRIFENETRASWVSDCHVRLPIMAKKIEYFAPKLHYTLSTAPEDANESGDRCRGWRSNRDCSRARLPSPRSKRGKAGEAEKSAPQQRIQRTCSPQALAVLDNPDTTHIDRLKAMLAAQQASASEADAVAVLTLQDYFALLSTSHRNKSEENAYVACGAVAHALIEAEAEVTSNAVRPCLDAAHDLQIQTDRWQQ